MTWQLWLVLAVVAVLLVYGYVTRKRDGGSTATTPTTNPPRRLPDDYEPPSPGNQR